MDHARAIFLAKLAEVLEMPPSHEVTSHFPFLDNQQIWKYKHKDGILALKNGETVYSFTFPEKLYPDEEKDNEAFNIKRLNEDKYRTMDVPEKTAQVHKSHPGQLYVTLHEGKRNPTYTLKHQDEDNWKAVLKKKLNKQIREMLPVEKTAYTTKEKLKRLWERRDPDCIEPRNPKYKGGANLKPIDPIMIKDLEPYTKHANLYAAGVNAFNGFTNLPTPLVAGGAIGGSYLWNKMRKQPDPYDQKHPIISKLMDYGIPAAAIMAAYYGGKGAFLPSATAAYSPV